MCEVIFGTRRMWSASTAREVAEMVFSAKARAGVYIFEAPDGTAIYVGRLLDALGSRLQRHPIRNYARVWAIESSCPGVDEVRLIAALLPRWNRETKSCPGDLARPKVADVLATKE